MTLLRVGGGAGLQAITSATTYYVCAKGSGGTCVYNGDGGTVATPSDSNACTTKALPCATIGGAQNKIKGQAIAAVVTIQLADTAGTGTDLYRPNGVVFNNTVVSGPPDSTIYLQERAANTLGAYPTAYLYLHGNDSTPGNVLICGSATCSTTATDAQGIVFTNTLARISGVKAEYFTSSASSSAFAIIRSVAYFDNTIFVGTGAANDAEWMAFCYDHSICRFGGTHTVTDAGFFDLVNYSQGNFRTPAGRANITSTVTNFSGGILFANENSYLAVDGGTIAVSGTGTTAVWRAYNHSTIYWNDDSTFTTPAWSVTVNGNGLTVDEAADKSFISDLCRTISALTCNIGNTTAVNYRARAYRNSYITYSTDATAVLNADTFEYFGQVNGASHAYMGYPSTAFAQLGTPVNGTMTYCADCAPASNPCTGTSTGSFAYRMNGAWKCF